MLARQVQDAVKRLRNSYLQTTLSCATCHGFDKAGLSKLACSCLNVINNTLLGKLPVCDQAQGQDYHLVILKCNRSVVHSQIELLLQPTRQLQSLQNWLSLQANQQGAWMLWRTRLSWLACWKLRRVGGWNSVSALHRRRLTSSGEPPSSTAHWCL